MHAGMVPVKPLREAGEQNQVPQADIAALAASLQPAR